MTHSRKSSQRHRTTVPLSGTVSRPPSHLCFETDLALKYACLWLSRAGGLKVPAPGVIRRALLLYMQHLTKADEGIEAAAVRRACTAPQTSEEAKQMALLRLYSTGPGEPLPAFIDVLRSQAERGETAATTLRADALAKRCIANVPAFRRVRP